VLQADGDAKPPHELTPAFYGCYGLALGGARPLAARASGAPLSRTELAAASRAALASSLTPDKIAGEVRYLSGEGRASFGAAYGLAWLLELAAELAEWPDDEARRWSAALEPLERAAAARLAEWLPKLSHAVRAGEPADRLRARTRARLGRSRGRTDLAALFEARTRELYRRIATAR